MKIWLYTQCEVLSQVFVSLIIFLLSSALKTSHFHTVRGGREVHFIPVSLACC